MSMVHFARLVQYTVGIHTMSTRKKKSVHVEILVHFRTNLSKCTESHEMYFWINHHILQDWYILVPSEKES